MISYERIFEKNNFTTEMVKGKQDELFTFTEFTKKLMSITPNVYGNVFLKYLEPIHL